MFQRTETIEMFCLNCGRKFEGHPHIHRYCSYLCREKFCRKKRAVRKIMAKTYASRVAWVARNSRSRREVPRKVRAPFGPDWVRRKIEENERGFGRKS